MTSFLVFGLLFCLWKWLLVKLSLEDCFLCLWVDFWDWGEGRLGFFKVLDVSVSDVGRFPVAI